MSVTTRYSMFQEEKTRKVTTLSPGTDTTVQTRNGRSSILTRRMTSQLLDLMKTVDSTETDHSI